MRLPSSLQSVFTLHFACAAVVPVLVFGLLADRYIAGEYLGQAERELSGHTLDIRAEVQTLLEDVLANLQFVRRSAMEMPADQPSGQIDRLFENAVATSAYFEAIYLLDERNRVKHLGVDEHFGGHAADYRGLDFSRHELISRPADHAPASLAGIRWSDSFVSLASGNPSVTVTLPHDGGTLMGVISLKRLDEMLTRRLHQRREIVYALVDRKGVLIAHSQPELARQRLNLLAEHPEIADTLASGREVDFKFHEDRTLIEGVRLVPETRWVVHASIRRDVAMAPLVRVRQLLAAVVAAAALIAAAGAYWLARRVVRPLHTLRDSLQGVTRGDYHGLERLGHSGYAELKELTANFLEMGATVLERETFLRASEERYRSLIAGMGEGLLIFNRDGRISDCNEVAERIFSRSRREIIDQEPLFRQWRTIREDGSEFPVEEHPYHLTLRDGLDVNNQLMGICPPDGREIWLQVNCRPQWATQGNAIAAVLTFADVTRLKVAEASLRLSKQRFQELYQQFSALLEGITDRITLINRGMNVLWSNQSPANSCIETDAGNSGRCCYENAFDRPDPCPACPVVSSFASGEPALGELADHKSRLWSLRSFPVVAQGEIAQVVVIAEDVTQQRESEKQRIRAGQLAALGELAAGVAHEINNPISGVINYAQLIANRHEDGSREHDLARRIIKEGDRIATIVRELLTFAREESSEIHIVSVREALAEALTLCESPLRKEAIDLRIDLPADLPLVESRSHQIQQLFLNLISNARHALTEKYPQSHPDKILTITGRPVEFAGRAGLQLKVRDHGAGIPAALLERVMNPFVTTKPAGVGTGLGLSICFEIAKKHGGVLSVDSRYGEWTEVTVVLPAHVRRGEGGRGDGGDGRRRTVTDGA